MDHDHLENELNAKQALNNLKNSLETMKGFLSFKAELERSYYEDLVEKGFTKKEALYLCQNVDFGSGENEDERG